MTGTQKFILTLLVLVAGVVLLLFDQTEAGWGLLAGGGLLGGGFAIHAKKNGTPPNFALLGLLLPLGALSSCGAVGTVPNTDDLQELVQALVARHDAYVEADGALEPEDRDAFLSASGGLLRAVAFGPAEIPAEELFGPVQAVGARHDAYVEAAAAAGELTDLKARTYLRSTQALHLLLAVAGGGAGGTPG